ncbi:hypothetical protein AA983_13030 [Dermacoccus sp. PE3]|uniref:hypothetical protein n=1 Tax=Dermacoccus sp. PE3 TaxID=1641401 RepID=UPI0006425E81|nr:hypothetical protein [Dermacoccus sp. PE3]KLO61880.1 hypothetical protein AA983_13030 [Dermacoccus sp. PE3]
MTEIDSHLSFEDAPRELEAISFALDSSGWMDCTFAASDGVPLTVRVSYVSDVLTDFLDAAWTLATESSRAASFVLHREPDATIVGCLATENDVLLLITSSDDRRAYRFTSTSGRLARLISDGVAAVDRGAYLDTWPTHPFSEERLSNLGELLGA